MQWAAWERAALGDQDGGRSAGAWVDGDLGEQGTEEARLDLGCPWVVEPGEWRDAAGLWPPLAARAPCTELHLKAAKGSDFRKRCKRSF